MLQLLVPRVTASCQGRIICHFPKWSTTSQDTTIWRSCYNYIHIMSQLQDPTNVLTTFIVWFQIWVFIWNTPFTLYSSNNPIQLPWMTTIIILFSFGAWMTTENPHMFFTSENCFLESSKIAWGLLFWSYPRSFQILLLFEY